MTRQEYYERFKMYPADRIVVNDTIMCPRCMKNPAKVPPGFGICDCQECCDKSSANLGGWPEFVPDYIKEDRRAYFKMCLQPYRDGVPSREYAEAYPEKAKAKFGNEKTEYVYKDLPGWSSRERSFGGQR